MKPKVGFVTFGYGAWIKSENVEALKEEALNGLKRINNIEIIEAPVIPKSIEDIHHITSFFRSKDVDIVVVFLADDSPEEFSCLFAKELFDYPMVLWALYDSPMSFLPLTAIIIMSGNLMRIGKKFFTVFGHPRSPETIRKLVSYVKAAWVAKRLKKTRIGVVGSLNLGMMDTGYSEFEMRKIVPCIFHLDTLELFTFFEEIDEHEARRIAEEFAGRVSKVDVPFREVILAAKSYLAMKKVVENYGLDALTIREWGSERELGARGFTMCLGSSILNEEGIVCVQESDISSTITALILRLLTGKPFFCGDISRAYIEKNVIVVFHEGAFPLALARDLKQVVLAPAVISVETVTGRAGGVSIQFPLKPGRVTIAKLSGRPLEGKVKMAIAGGEMLEYTEPVKRGHVVGYLRPDAGAKKFIRTWIEEGFEHHLVVVYDDVLKELKALCDILGITKVVIQ